MNCPKCRSALEEVFSPQGVIIDKCAGCSGLWFDRNEISFFVKDPKRLHYELSRIPLGGFSPAGPSCPRCQTPILNEGTVLGDIKVDVCPKCTGVYLDADELEKINLTLATAVKEGKAAKALPAGFDELSARIDRPLPAGTPPLRLASLPGLGLRSLGVFTVLSSLVFAAFFAFGELLRWDIHAVFAASIAAIFLQYLLAPWIMDLTLRWTMSMRWAADHDLPAPLRHFVARVCAEENLTAPRFGVIADGTPNAFTYGHTPHNARIVVTQGLLDVLNERELNAVVAHEMGHAVHWDIAVMTLASAIPLVLYYFFRILWDMASRAAASRSKDSGKAAMPLYLSALAAYLIYVLSEFIVLYLSRVRELWADRYSGEKTRNPNDLAMALVKIAYGLAGAREKSAPQETRRDGRLDTVQALSIFDRKGALAVVATSLAEGGRLNMSSVVAAMQWDLWNPWAGFYEVQSTHPLPARRIDALCRQAMAYGKEPLVAFDLEKPESYWDEFLVDLAALLLPAAMVAGGAGVFVWSGQWSTMGWPLLTTQLLFLYGLGSLGRTFFSYKFGFFPDFEVAGLLKNVKVSGVRGVPCEVKGRIIGRGVPGLIWSEDLVLQDASGYIFLDYRQPLRIWELLFGLFRAQDIIGKAVTVRGWYRRAPVPYVEMYELFSEDGTSKKCHVYAFKILASIVMMAVGVYFAAASAYLK